MQQSILSGITNIKVSGVATMSYWSILETSDSIYFVQAGSAIGAGTGSLLIAISVLGDILASRRARQVLQKDLATVLSEAKQYYGFSKESLGDIQTASRLFGGGTIWFPNGQKKSWTESGYVKLKLSRKKYRLFKEMLQRKLTS